MMNNNFISAPELEVADWLNTSAPLTLSELRGKIVVIHAFQMLCPGCVQHGLPQTTSIYEFYHNETVQVIGLHSVFEHHDVMTKEALTAFVHEYRLRFPIAIDKPSEIGVIPVTMKNYQLQGTPSLIIIDQQGKIRLNYFGRLSDMQVGNFIGKLMSVEENIDTSHHGDRLQNELDDGQCDDNVCKS